MSEILIVKTPSQGDANFKSEFPLSILRAQYTAIREKDGKKFGFVIVKDAAGNDHGISSGKLMKLHEKDYNVFVKPDGKKITQKAWAKIEDFDEESEMILSPEIKIGRNKDGKLFCSE